MTSLKDPRIRTTIPPLTSRQREVLSLLARGYSNPQIGEALGISLDGAKWHVSEILARLGVDSREEAAAYWRDYNRPGARLARFARAVVPVATWAKWGAAVAGIGAVSAIAVVTVVAMSAGGPDTHLAAAPSATATTSVQATTTAASTTIATSQPGTTTPAPGTPSAFATAPVSATAPPATTTPSWINVPSVDRAIAAMQAKDYAELASQLVTHNEKCGVTPPPDSWTSPCAAGVATGTVQAAYMLSNCDGPTYMPASTAASTIGQLLSGNPGIYAVVKDADGTYRAIFKDGSESAFTLTVTSAGITTVSRACGASPSAVLAAASQSSVLYPSDEASGAALTGIPSVDSAVAAVDAADYPNLASQLVTHDEPCGLNPPPADSWLSPCALGVAKGTVQAVYTVGGCDGPTWIPASTAAATFAGMIKGVPHLYGVKKNPDGTYSAIFADEDPSAFTLSIATAGVTTVSRACGVSAATFFPTSGTVVAGPFDQ